LKRFCFEKQDAIVAALHKDLRKHEMESKFTELSMLFEDVDLAINNLHDWVKERPVSKPNLLLWGLDKMMLRPEPYGVTLIISPWNYPIQLSLVTLVGAIAAGNCTLLKPSELSPSTEKILAEDLPKYLDPEAFAVYVGGPNETAELLQNNFDHILFTGSTSIGKIVMAAAAKHLTPVTLELGGKSPTIIDETCDLNVAARRICWGKFLNSGQSCIAPDYVIFTAPNLENKFVEYFANHVKSMFGDDPQTSPSYGRIINQRHFDRIVGLLNSGELGYGGKHDKNDLYIEPTLLKNVHVNDPVMKDEIFGPILPTFTVNSLEDAVAHINDNPKPLALYHFTTDKKRIEYVKNMTSSGAYTSNDTMAHAACNTLPFGGVGPSGIGGYHGKHSFEAFSHMKPVLIKYPGMEFLNDVRVAPYTKSKQSQLLFFLGYPTSLKERNLFKPLIAATAVAAVAYLTYSYL